jgi:hypothetical protein
MALFKFDHLSFQAIFHPLAYLSLRFRFGLFIITSAIAIAILRCLMMADFHLLGMSQLLSEDRALFMSCLDGENASCLHKSISE